MGLKRLEQKDSHFYMYFNISSPGGSKQTLEAVILAKDNPSTVKVTTGNGDLQQWCVKLGRSPEEYLEQLCEAVLSEDDNVGVFEVQEDHLVWKQYSPDMDIYGKKGKFKLEKVEYEKAVEQVLAGVMRDLHNSSRKIHRLTQESQENTRKLDEALELASKSVQMKEDLENEIYSKCAALINAKKLRIHQLRSTHPSSSAGRTSCLVRASDEVGTSTPPVKKPRKQEADNSDGYSSDTDVDDPDEEMDTDEERAVTLSSVKPSRERGMTSSTRQGEVQDQGQVSSRSKAPKMDDSQELFNASLETELFPSSATMVQRGGNSAVPPPKPDVQSPPQLMRSKAAEPVPSSSLTTSNCDYDDDTQTSIINTLF